MHAPLSINNGYPVNGAMTDGFQEARLFVGFDRMAMSQNPTMDYENCKRVAYKVDYAGAT